MLVSVYRSSASGPARHPMTVVLTACGRFLRRSCLPQHARACDRYQQTSHSHQPYLSPRYDIASASLNRPRRPSASNQPPPSTDNPHAAAPTAVNTSPAKSCRTAAEHTPALATTEAARMSASCSAPPGCRRSSRPIPRPTASPRTPPPVGGAVPVSTPICVAMMLVTCADVSGARYNDDDDPLVVNATGTGSGSFIFANSAAIGSAASLANRIVYAERSCASDVTCTSTSRTMALKFACRDGAATCTSRPATHRWQACCR